MGQCRSPSVSPSRQAASSSSLPPDEQSLFQQYVQEGNPFEMHSEHKEEETEDVLASNGVSVRSSIRCSLSPVGSRPLTGGARLINGATR